jgi:superfamily II DNA or RNA helicase
VGIDMNYQEFLQRKNKNIIESGFDIQDEKLNKNLFPFQRHTVKVALKKGKFALLADCGLGKTIMQLEWANQVSIYTGKPVLILCPLAVTGQTIKEADRFGIKAGRNEQMIQVSNYEQISNIDTSLFAGIVLDESSILKNFDGSTKKLIIEKFKHTPYKLACTATPSPNDDMEICNHAEFLNIKSRSEILATYFTHDGGETAKWRLKKHAEGVFWDFVKQWAIVISTPSDIGYSDNGYVLPRLNYITREIKTEQRQIDKIFNDIAISATNFNQELKLTIHSRLNEVAEIVNNSTENFIIWIKQDIEGQYLRDLIPGSIEVKGSDSPLLKESRLLGFANNEFRVLITKTKIAQFGLNYQNCRNQVFPSLDFSFEGLYQAIRRSYRFGQKNEVNIYLIVTDTMTNVIKSINRKENQFNNMKLKLKYVSAA